jgi:hypothetical protein
MQLERVVTQSSVQAETTTGILSTPWRANLV